MEQSEFVYTADAPRYGQARMRLEVEGMLGSDDAVDPAGLVDALVARGWQVGIN